MKQQNLTEISRASGKSISTVSKVLRGCGGVDDDTRVAVLCAAAEYTMPSYEPKQSDVFVILPDNPKYFWARAREGMHESRLPITFKIFSAIRKDQREFLVARYIEEAIASEARVLIVSAKLTEKMQERLAKLAERMLVIQLCEYTPIANTFFVGSDGERDGRTLARYLPSESEQELRIGVMTGSVSHASDRRVKGFLSALPSSAKIFSIEKPTEIELYSSHLARAIDAIGTPLDYLFCFDGITTAACDALYKLRGKMNTRLLGFEYPPTAKKHMDAGRIAALAVQKPEEQMRTALRLAERYLRTRSYPDQKYTYLPSELVTLEREK